MLSVRDQVHINNNYLTPVVNIITILLFIISVLAVLGRLFAKGAVIRGLKMDDYTILIALLLSVGQTIAALVSTSNGIGIHWDSLDDPQKIRMQKTLYASEILYIPVIVLSKLSIVYFIRDLAPFPASKRLAFIYSAVLISWGVASEFAAAFQCRVPEVWKFQGNSCFNTIPFWIAFDILNILTDIALVIWPVILISKIQATMRRRSLIVFCFACRILVIGAAIAQIIMTYRAEMAIDISFRLWPLIVCCQLVQSLTISTACVPYLRPILSSVKSGLIRPDDLRRRKQDGFGEGRGGGIAGFHAGFSSTAVPLRPMNNVSNTATVETEGRHWDQDSAGSRAGIIDYVTSFSVDTAARSPEGK